MSRRRARLAFAGLLVGVAVALLWGWRRGAPPKGDRAAQVRDSAKAEGAPPALARGDEPTLAPRAAIERARLAGRVTEAGGTPVAGALVCARGSDDALSDDELGAPRCAASSADGQYLIADLHPARYEVDASAPGFLPAAYRADRRASIPLAPGEQRDSIDLVLARGGVEVNGRVMDIGGGPVAFAHISLRSDRTGLDDAGRANVRADERGQWRATVLAGPLVVAALAPGYTVGVRDTAAPGTFIEILLTPEAVLVGRVVRAGSADPVPGALVSANPIDFSSWSSGRSATSDGDGRFRIERLSPGRYKPRATVRDGEGMAAASVRLGVAARSPEVLIELHPAASVAGHVVLADGQTPCPEGFVVLTDPAHAQHASGSVVGTAGDVAIAAVRPGRYRVSVSCTGHPDTHDHPPLVVAERSLSGLRFVVKAGQTVAGVVEGGDRRGVSGVLVYLEDHGDDPRAPQRQSSATTKADGSFAIEGVAPGRHVARIYGDDVTGPSDPTPVTVVAGRDVAGVRIVLERFGSIEGQVVAEHGRALGRLTIWATNRARERAGGEAISRDDGSFAMAGLVAGEYRVTALRRELELRAPGTSDDDVHGTLAVVKAGQTTRVRLVLEREDGVIKGQVLEGGKPVQDAFVDAERESDSAAAHEHAAAHMVRNDWERQPALTDVDGRFVLTGLGPGRYTVRAFRKGGGEAVREHVEVGSSAILVIAPTGVLAGRVVATSAGASPERFSVTVEDAQAGLSRREHFERTAGRWQIQDLPAGRFNIVAQAPEGTALEQVALPEGQKREGITLKLTPRGKVTGRVIALETGKPLPGMTVRAAVLGKIHGFFAAHDDGDDRRNVTDANGRFEIDDAPAGRVSIMALDRHYETSQYPWGMARATVAPGTPIEVPPIRCAGLRHRPPNPSGDLGFTLRQPEPNPMADPVIHIVALVRPGGPAAGTGLRPGDVIVSVDGVDVTGEDDYLYYNLSLVAPDAEVRLGLARGVSVVVKAGLSP